jgi:Lrp/AsnC family leucine-responsive transcriptional regulator
MIQKRINRKTFENEKLLDRIGLKICSLLAENARLPLAEIGRLVGLSAPAVAERIRRMEGAGIISGYHAEISPDKIGLLVLAFIRMQVPREKYQRLITFADKSSEVLECHHISGEDSFILKVAVPSVADLEPLITGLSGYGSTMTSIVLASPIRKYVVEGKSSETT